jgi:replicative DNA helicase
VTNDTPSLLGRTLPHSPEAERKVLAGIFMGGVVDLSKAMDGHLKPECFFIANHRLIYQTLLWMHKNGMELTLAVMVEELTKLGKLEEIGGIDFLMGISREIPTTAELGYFITRVRESYVQREVISTCLKSTELAYQEESKVEDFTYEMNKILSIRNATQTMKTLTQAANDTLEQIERIKSGKATAEDLGLTWAWPAWDDKFGPKIPGQMIVVGARPGMGKSTVLRQDALHVSKKYGHTAIFSREMPVGDLPPLFAQTMCGISWKNLLRGKLHPREVEDFIRAVQAVRALRNLHIYDRDKTLSQLMARVKAAAQILDLKYLGVDYLQRYDPQQERGETRDMALGRITGAMKDLAIDLKIPVLLLCQINREVEREHREPVISDLRESGNIEQDADRVILLHAPGTDKVTGNEQDINDQTLTQIYIEAIQAKGRGDGRARCDMYLNLPTTTFRPAFRGSQTNTGQQRLPPDS